MHQEQNISLKNEQKSQWKRVCIKVVVIFYSCGPWRLSGLGFAPSKVDKLRHQWQTPASKLLLGSRKNWERSSTSFILSSYFSSPCRYRLQTTAESLDIFSYFNIDAFFHLFVKTRKGEALDRPWKIQISRTNTYAFIFLHIIKLY